MTTTARIPDLAVLLLSYGAARWLVLKRRGALRLLMHSPKEVSEKIWQDAMMRAGTMGEQMEGMAGAASYFRVNLQHNFTGASIHDFLRERLRTDPSGMQAAFEQCLEAEQQMAVPA